MIDLVPDERTTCGVDPANLGTEEAVYSKRSDSDFVMPSGWLSRNSLPHCLQDFKVKDQGFM
jgi:hypothetical protein